MAVTSILKIFDLSTGRAQEVRRFPFRMEAPNWTRDGQNLIYNTGGRLYRLHLPTGEILPVNTGIATRCNNDHVLSPDGSGIAVSSGTDAEFGSKIFIVPFETGEARLVVPTPGSYLHGWSPDGKTLCYCAMRKVNGEEIWDVFAMDTRGGQEIRLTDAPGLDDGPEYSPDGKHIWFNSVRTGLMQLWRMNADGSEQTQMTFSQDRNAWFPHVSPDGSKVVYLSYGKGDLEPWEHLPDKTVELRLIPAEGGAEVTLLELFGGQGTINVNSWAPDSTRFAFVSYEIT